MSDDERPLNSMKKRKHTSRHRLKTAEMAAEVGHQMTRTATTAGARDVRRVATATIIATSRPTSHLRPRAQAFRPLRRSCEAWATSP